MFRLAALALTLVALVACQAPPGPPTATPSPPPPTATAPQPTATPDPRDLAVRGTPSVSYGDETARLAIDGDPQTLWYSQQFPPEWYAVTLAGPALVDRIELLVTQNPPGPTTHEVWLGAPDGSLKLYKRLTNAQTADGQELVVPVDPPEVVSRVLVRTLTSPSQVGWRRVSVLGVPTVVATPSPTLRSRSYVEAGLQLPTGIYNAGDGSGRLFVLEQGGKIRLIGKDGVLRPTPFLDLSDRVIAHGEQGLLGLAFPPDFARKRYFYASYTTSKTGPDRKPGDDVFARFRVTADPDVADAASEQDFLIIPEPNEFHNGGHMAFGPKDGYLYIGVGDGGPQYDPDNRGQSTDTLLGKMLRLDTESGAARYAVPPDNPFIGMGDRRPELWAYGLRNPWGFAFDQRTGDLFIADVGEAEWEEVDYQPASSAGGENYGWRIREGDQCYHAIDCTSAGLVPPIAQYHHIDGCAITGGVVYRGSRVPALQGAFVHSDYCSGRVWSTQRQGNTWVHRLLYTAGFPVTSVGEDESGELYIADYTHGRVLALDPATS